MDDDALSCLFFGRARSPPRLVRGGARAVTRSHSAWGHAIDAPIDGRCCEFDSSVAVGCSFPCFISWGMLASAFTYCLSV